MSISLLSNLRRGAASLTFAALAAAAFVQSASAGNWVASERLETARAGLAAASHGDVIYVGGGAAAGDPNNAFDMFDAANESWRAMPALPKGLMNFAMAASDSAVFISGGFSADAPGEPRKEFWAFDTTAASWDRKSSMPHARAGHAMVHMNGRVYVIGGGTGPEAAKVLIYNVASDRWSTGASLPTPRRALAAASDGKRIYAVGGIRSDGQVTGALEMFDPAAGAWTTLPALAQPRGALTAGVLGKSLHVVGGARWSPIKTFANHDVFDLGSRQWSKGPPMPTARQALASGVASGRLWVIGGGSGAGVFGVFTASDAVEAYEP